MKEEEEDNNQNNEQKEKAELEEFIPKEKENRLTAINSRDTRDTVGLSGQPPDIEEENTCSMKEGSIQGGVFALSSLALGTGAFSLPIRCTQLGLFWNLIIIIIGALAAYWTLSGLIKSSRKVRGEDYSPTVKRLIGKKPSVFIDLIVIIYLFGVFIQYQVVIYELLGRTIFEFFGDKDKYSDFEAYQNEVWDSAKYKYPIMLSTTTLIVPICLLKNISKMRFASMFGICALVYCIIVVVVQTPWFFKDYLKNYKEDDKSTHANWFDITKGFSSNLDIFTGIANVFFCYSCHVGAFPVFKTLKNNTEKRINEVFFRSISLVLIIYIFVSICGFMTAPLKPKSLIIYRDSIFDNDIFMTIAKIALALDLFLCLPANFASFRCSFFINFFKTDKIDNFRNLLVTIPTMYLSALIGALYSDILDYISLFGGFCSSIMCYLIPGVLMIVTSDEKITSRKNICTIVAVTCLTTFGFMGGVQTVRGVINKHF
jgi:amino acid permease